MIRIVLLEFCPKEIMTCAQKLCIARDLSHTLREYLRTWTNTQNTAKKGKESMCSYA